jgi:hypothetical protein
MTRTLIATVLTIAGLSTVGQTARAEHIDDLAFQLQRQSRDLYLEFRQHYSHTRGYRHLISDSAEMYRLAGHIHEIAHHAGSLVHLRSDLKELDRLFHHIEDLVDDIEHDARFGHHGGHIHGSTRHVRHLLHEIEDTLHHLLDDVNELVRRQAVPFHQHAVPQFQPAPPVAPVGPGNGFRFSVGGRGISFHFGK